MLRDANVATPPAAFTVVVPPPGVAPSERVTSPAKSETSAPFPSLASTTTAGAAADPAVAFTGSTLKASWLAPGGGEDVSLPQVTATSDKTMVDRVSAERRRAEKRRTRM